MLELQNEQRFTSLDQIRLETTFADSGKDLAKDEGIVDVAEDLHQFAVHPQSYVLLNSFPSISIAINAGFSAVDGPRFFAVTILFTIFFICFRAAFNIMFLPAEIHFPAQTTHNVLVENTLGGRMLWQNDQCHVSNIRYCYCL